MQYLFQPFMHMTDTHEGSRRTTLSIPELTDGFDASLAPPTEGMVPITYHSKEVAAGTYAIHIAFEAVTDIDQVFLFTGRKLLRDIISLRQGQLYEQTFYQSVAEIIPRYHEDVYPVRNLFFTLCTRQPDAIRLGFCYAEPAENIPVVYLCGDSTVTDQSSEIPYHPGACYASWGQALPAFLNDPVAVENQAHCGLTTETFRSEGHMDIVKKYIRPGDFCMIQFGHNDQKLPHLLADREYPVNLRRYVAEVKAAGATPVLVTSPGRNIWKPDGTYHELLAEHVQAVKDVAEETGVACIDLHDFSVGCLKKHGMERSCGYFHPGDYTHNNEYGAYLLASFLARELHRLYPGVFAHIKEPAAFAPPVHLWNLLEQGNNRVVGTEQKEQFDCMEKSTAALLEALQNAQMN